MPMSFKDGAIIFIFKSIQILDRIFIPTCLNKTWWFKQVIYIYIFNHMIYLMGNINKCYKDIRASPIA